MRLPPYDELDKEQIDILEYPCDKSLFVAGPPGSGKTIMAVHRYQSVMEHLRDAAPPARTAAPAVPVLTRNRMLRRQLELLKARAQTMHKFVWHDYMKRTGEEPPQSAPYKHIWPLMLEGAARSPSCTAQHAIIDEGQDLPGGFHRYASEFVAPVLSVFADEDQAVHDMKTSLIEIKAAAGLDNPILLQNNHRNSPEISRLAEHFHSGSLPAATVHRPETKELPRLVRTDTPRAIASRIRAWTQTRGGSIGVVCDDRNYGIEIQKHLQRLLPDVNVPRYDSKGRNEADTNTLEDGVVVINMKSCTGLEFDSLFILQLECFLPGSPSGTTPPDPERRKRIMYMLCTRARDHLFLVYGPRPLPGMAARSLPGDRILERLDAPA